MRVLLTILAALFVVMPAHFAQAQEANPELLKTDEFCTTPREVEDIAPNDNKRWKYCDINMRQFEYRERYKELQKRLTTRSENFKNSTYAVRQNYKKELEKYHASLGSDSN